MLRWYQREAADAVWCGIRQPDYHPVVELPTGAGKSWVIADLCRRAVQCGGRALVIAHRQELLVQNADKIRQLLPHTKVGIYSAGIGQRDVESDVVCCGIQSVQGSRGGATRAWEFGARQISIVDEAHLVNNTSDETMYHRFLTDLSVGNKWHRHIGLTATPYRLSQGLITDGSIWSEICYRAPLRQLIEEGWLCPLVSQAGESQAKDVHVRGGEFIAREVEDAFMALVEPVANEIVGSTSGRHSILVFCPGVAHAETLSRRIESMTGESVGCITGQSLPLERRSALSAFRDGSLRWLVNVDVLTTGFDAPNCDAIAVCRMTKSAGLFAQICGRGLRTDASKTDCLILDFGGNLRRHGPLDAENYGRQSIRESRGGGEAPEKQCENCDAFCAASSLTCHYCGAEFPRPERKVEAMADTSSEILAKTVEAEVVELRANRHHGRPGKQDTLRITYVLDQMLPGEISEWLCVEHEGWAQKRFARWWLDHSYAPIPTLIDDAVDLIERGAIRCPRTISYQRDGKFYKVVGREFDGDRPETWADIAEEVYDPFEEEGIPF